MESNLLEEVRMAKRSTTRLPWQGAEHWAVNRSSGKGESCPTSLSWYCQRKDAMQCVQAEGHKPAIREEIALKTDLRPCGYSQGNFGDTACTFYSELPTDMNINLQIKLRQNGRN